MFHGIQKNFSIHNIDIQMMCALIEITIQNMNQIFNTLRFIFSQCIRNNGECIGNTILTYISIRNFCNRIQRSQCTIFVPAMHGICTGSQRFPMFSTIRCCTCFFAIHDIACDGQSRQCMFCIAVDGMLL